MTTNNVIQFPNRKDTSTMNKPVTYRDTSRGPIPFERLRPGSMFRIVAEPSRHIYRSKDGRIYQKDYKYFYSTEVGKADHSIVLYPNDLVMPVVQERGRAGHAKRDAGANKIQTVRKVA